MFLDAQLYPIIHYKDRTCCLSLSLQYLKELFALLLLLNSLRRVRLKIVESGCKITKDFSNLQIFSPLFSNLFFSAGCPSSKTHLKISTHLFKKRLPSSELTCVRSRKRMQKYCLFPNLQYLSLKNCSKFYANVARFAPSFCAINQV